MKKMGCLLLAAAAILLLAACAAENAAPSGATVPAPTELPSVAAEPAREPRTVITATVARHSGKTEQWWADLEKAFEEANPEYDLEVTCVSWHDIDAVLREQIAAGSAPDLANTDQLFAYQSQGLLLRAEQWVSQKTYDNFYPQLHSRATAEGSVWGVPDFVIARAMYYNKDILSAAGVAVPTTWKELVSACQTIRSHDPEVYPWGVDMTMDEGYACFAYYIWNNGSDFMDVQGNWTLNDPRNLNAVEFITNMVQRHLTNPDPTAETRYQCQDWFGQGKVAMMIGPSSLPAYCASNGDMVNYGIAPLPANGDNPSVSTATGNFLLCFKDESRTEGELAAVTALVDAIYGDAAYTRWVQEEGFLPATVSGNALLGIQDPQMAVWDQILRSLKFYPESHGMWGIFREDIVNALQTTQWNGNAWLRLEELQKKVMNP